MRIAIISEYYHPRIGGAERVTRAIAEAVAGSGRDAHVLTSGDQRMDESINDVTVHRFDIAGNLVKGITGDTRAIEGCLDELKPGIIIVYALQTWGSDLFLRREYLSRNGCRVIAIPCGLSALSSPLRRVYYHGYLRRLRTSWRRFDHYVFHTRQGNDYRFLGKLTADRSSIIPNFFPSDVLDWSRAAADGHLRDLGLDHLIDTPFVLNVSNHYCVKGHAALISKFRKTFPGDWQLVIAGGIPSAGRSCYARCSAASVRSDRITMLDGADRKLVLSLYQRASLFFLTSQIEYFPLVLLEAQAIGLPFLSYPVGNAGELNGGIVVRPRDLTRRYITDMLAQPEMLKNLGARGRQQSLAEHSEPLIQERYLRLLQRMIDAPERP